MNKRTETSMSIRQSSNLMTQLTDYSYLGLFVPWMIRTMDISYLGRFVLRTIPTIRKPFSQH